MSKTLGREEKLRVKRAVLKHFASSPKTVSILELLLERAINQPGQKVSYRDLMDVEGGPTSEDAARGLVSRLRSSLENFFNADREGRSQKWKATLAGRGYEISFEKNDPPEQETSGEFRDGFWQPFIGSKQPVVILYSEPYLYRDEHDPMILLSAPLGGPGRQFAPPHDGLRPFHGAVPTGVMRSLFGLTNFLQGEKTPVSQNSLRTMQDAEPAVDLIVLVTPGMPSKVITRLEAGLPIPLFQSHSEGQHKDGTKDSGRGPAVRNQEVVLTLRPHRVSGKCILILSSESPGAIEALSLFLLENRQIKNLAEALNCGHTFPDYFQVVLSVAALETDPEAFIGPLVIEQQHILSPPSGGRQKHQNTRRMLP